MTQLVTLQGSGGLSITCMDLGATWLSCQVPIAEKRQEVLLGASTPEEHVANYLGTTVGRYANRIHKGQIKINSETIQLDVNQAGNTLHGGSDGFHKRAWQVREHSNQHIEYQLESANGDQGFPGTVLATVRYLVTDDNTVEINYEATTDKLTPINLTNHAYFNLVDVTGKASSHDHVLKINADHYLPVDDEGIPCSAPTPVATTDFDFRSDKKVATDYDHSFLLKTNTRSQPAAELSAPGSSIRMQVFTDKPALQLYTGAGLKVPNAGLALESQFLPDSPNHPEWPQPSCFFGPEDQYRFTTRFKFLLPVT